MKKSISEHRKTFIPDTETLKQKIREQIHPDSLSALSGECCEPQGLETGYHGLFVRLGQEGMKGKIKTIIFQITRFLTLWQERINQNIHQAALGLGRAMMQMKQRQDQLGENLFELKNDITTVEENVSEMEAGFKKNLFDLRDIVKEQLDEHRRLMFQQQRDFDRLMATGNQRLPQPFEKQVSITFSEKKHHFLDGLYLAFENRFRGSREAIKKRLAVYMPIVVRHFDPSDILVLDIGCGRGEWLEILKENGIAAKGVDANRFAVSQCREYGLDATEADALTFLKTIPESAVHAVTGFHIVEHLTFEQLISLLDEVHRVLRPGGVAVFETPNPANILVSAYDFYRDPSHKNPVHPDTIRFFAEFRGFQKAAIHLVEQKDDQCRLIDFDAWRLDVLQHYIDIPRDYVLVVHKKA